MAKAAILVPYPEMCDIIRPMLAQYDNITPMCMEYAHTEQIKERAKELEYQGCELMIARGLYAKLAKQSVKIPVVEMRVTAQEIGMLILELKKELRMERPRIGLIGFENMLCDTTYFPQLFDIELPRYMVESMDDLIQYVDKAREEGCHAIIGGDVACARAQGLGLPCRFIPSGRESLQDAFSMASQIGYAIDLEKKNRAEMDTMLNYTFSGIMQIDREGTILRANRVLFEEMGMFPKEILGRHISAVLHQAPQELFEQALHEGKESYAIHIPVGKRAVVVNIAPIRIDQEIQGAILTFQEGGRIEEMNSELRRDLFQRGYIARVRFSQLPQESGESRETVAMAKRISKYHSPVLMTGEPGCGKSVLAQCIHNEGFSKGNAFVSLDCSAFSEDVLDTMLFGNVTTRKDAPTSLAEIAQNGTLYLAQVDALTPELQYKVLNLVRGYLMHNGSRHTVASNVRIIASCSQDLFIKVKKGEFRHDLYYALSVLCLKLQPLRAHKEDIGGWVNYYLERFQRKHRRYVSLTKEAEEFLTHYDWPGNLDQLRNVCERMVLLSDQRYVGDGFLRSQVKQIAPEILPEAGRVVVFKDGKAARIVELLREYDGNRKKVADELGVSTTTLWRYMKKYGIGRDYSY